MVSSSQTSLSREQRRRFWTLAVHGVTTEATTLRAIMREIHTKCLVYGKNEGSVNYVRGANIAGFIKVANAMLAYGAV